MENMALSLVQTVGLVGWCSLPWSLENEDRVVLVTSTLLLRARSLASSDVLAIWWCWLIMRFIVQAGILLTVGITHGQQRPSRLMGGGERPGSDGTARGRAGSRGGVGCFQLFLRLPSWRGSSGPKSHMDFTSVPSENSALNSNLFKPLASPRLPSSTSPSKHPIFPEWSFVLPLQGLQTEGDMHGALPLCLPLRGVYESRAPRGPSVCQEL